MLAPPRGDLRFTPEARRCWETGRFRKRQGFVWPYLSCFRTEAVFVSFFGGGGVSTWSREGLCLQYFSEGHSNRDRI